MPRLVTRLCLQWIMFWLLVIVYAFWLFKVIDLHKSKTYIWLPICDYMVWLCFKFESHHPLSIYSWGYTLSSNEPLRPCTPARDALDWATACCTVRRSPIGWKTLMVAPVSHVTSDTQQISDSSMSHLYHQRNRTFLADVVIFWNIDTKYQTNEKNTDKNTE